MIVPQAVVYREEIDRDSHGKVVGVGLREVHLQGDRQFVWEIAEWLRVNAPSGWEISTDPNWGTSGPSNSYGNSLGVMLSQQRDQIAALEKRLARLELR